MDIEAVNKEYLKLKSDLQKTRKEVDKLEDTVNTLVEDRTIWNGECVKAKRNKDAAAEKKAADEMDRIDEEIKKLKEVTLKKKEELSKIQEKINDRINEIKENPEMKKHLDEVMAKKYERQISKLEKEKKEVTEKKERLTELKQLVTDHPVLGNHLKAYMKDVREAQNKIKKYQAEILDKTKPISQAHLSAIINVYIPMEKEKISNNKNKDILVDYITKNGLNIKEQDIEELASHGFVEVGKDGAKRIDLDATINRDMKGLDRKIKGFDKSIQDYQIALNGKDRGEKTAVETSTPSTTSTVVKSNESEQTTEEKPKWYQFIKRFKNWNEKRKTKALPKAEEEKEENKTESKTENKKNEFSSSLKYEIVQDIVNQTKSSDLKEAKKERKSEDKERV